ncbi:MAG TPA: cytochrome c family protein [Acetobacteraceae bacterium]|nr:cytochrome c family protein [Acetobacteraceae bacterium]
MDSMDVNKGIAAVLVVGIVFFLTGLIGDNLVRETEPSKPALDIKVSSVPAAEASKPEPLQPISPLLASADPAAGEAYTKRVCTVCHTFNDGGKPLVGPNLYGVVAGPHDHEEGFNYSPALEKFKGQPWTYEALNEWLFKPSQVAPGTRMTFAGIPSAKDRANVIAYLRTLSKDPVPLPKPGEAAPAAATPAAAAPPARTTPASGAPGTNAPAQSAAPAATPAAAPPPATTTPANGAPGTNAPAQSAAPAATPAAPAGAAPNKP